MFAGLLFGLSLGPGRVEVVGLVVAVNQNPRPGVPDLASALVSGQVSSLLVSHDAVLGFWKGR